MAYAYKLEDVAINKPLAIINQPHGSTGYTRFCTLTLANYNIKPEQMFVAVSLSRYGNSGNSLDAVSMSAGIYDKRTDTMTVTRYGNNYGYLIYNKGIDLHLGAGSGGSSNYTGRSRILLFYFTK